MSDNICNFIPVVGSVPAIESEERPVVAYGKHLCGPATGMAPFMGKYRKKNKKN